ncbi:L,D-transpeptidase family protein [Microbulbifer halophilus]|uniref:L,D-transpeptidase family protein n=1 Tax=Microbulbifer halophilus TaxID=453963 RepID=UPI00361F0CC8
MNGPPRALHPGLEESQQPLLPLDPYLLSQPARPRPRRPPRRGSGGAIMIHGMKPQWKGMESYLQKMNWTDGCIAVTNREMDEIWAMVKTPTPIDIYP